MLSNELDPRAELLIEVPSRRGNGERIDFLRWPTRTSDDSDEISSFHIRLLCMFLLWEMPNRALEEAAESMISMWTFYRKAPISLPRPTKPDAIPVRLGQPYDRPEFQASEE